MNCRCGFLMSVRAGGGYECRRCGQTEQVPVKAPVNWAACGATDQTLPPPPPAPVVEDWATIPDVVVVDPAVSAASAAEAAHANVISGAASVLAEVEIRHVPRPPDPEPEVENPTDPVVPRDVQPVSRRPFGRGRSKP
jgi:hypothetical protein